jgi:hypothetical protein
LAPEGIRTVSGIYNNIIPGRETWGSADQPMPNLLDQVWRAGEDNPRTPGVDITSYTQIAGNVYDSAPRTVSNLVADQTLNNKAAVIAALTRAGSADPYADADRIANARAEATAAAAALVVAQGNLDGAQSNLTAAQQATALALAQRDGDLIALTDFRSTLVTEQAEVVPLETDYNAQVNILIGLFQSGAPGVEITAQILVVQQAQLLFEAAVAEVNAAQLNVDNAEIALYGADRIDDGVGGSDGAYLGAVAAEVPFEQVVADATTLRDAAQTLATQTAGSGPDHPPQRHHRNRCYRPGRRYLCPF